MEKVIIGMMVAVFFWMSGSVMAEDVIRIEKKLESRKSDSASRTVGSWRGVQLPIEFKIVDEKGKLIARGKNIRGKVENGKIAGRIYQDVTKGEDSESCPGNFEATLSSDGKTFSGWKEIVELYVPDHEPGRLYMTKCKPIGREPFTARKTQ